MIFDYAVHSGFLIHWTGHDFDNVDWHGEDKSKTDEELTKRYLERLRDILTYGLWMTEEEGKAYLGSISVPSVPKCCFTELKLSESRKHARAYGRLGIGIKRPYFFNRFGRPVVYFGFRENRYEDQFLESCVKNFRGDNAKLLNFFKPMNRDTGPLTYEYYSESEWRIILFEELINSGKIIDPKTTYDQAARDYFNGLSQEQKERLKYLLPLDGWFSMIIYPSLEVKNAAHGRNQNYQQLSDGIIHAIRRIKDKEDDHANKVEGGNWPIEVDLDACRNF